MALFNRDHDTQNLVDTTDTTPAPATNPNDTGPISLPESPEVTQDYYQTPLEATPTTSSGRRPVLIVIGALVALLLVFGLVMGGRWAYHEFKRSNSPSKKPATAQSTPAPKNVKPQATTPPQSSSVAPAPSTTTPAPGSASNSTPNTPQTTPQTTTPTTPSTTPSTAPGATPAAGSNLTNTGPGETLAIFVIVSILGASAYQFRLRLNRTRG